MLSGEGYEIEERNVSDAFHASVLESLGFWVPTVVVGARAFPGFPEEALRRELGLPPGEGESLEERLATTLDVLEVVSGMVPHIPDELWEHRLAEERDRPLGQWVWHIFRFVEVVIEGVETGQLDQQSLREMSERKYWTQEREYGRFAEMGGYAESAVERLRRWVESGVREDDGRTVSTPWGDLSVSGVSAHMLRHSATHLYQLVGALEALAPDMKGMPSREVLDSLPFYHTRAAD